MSIGILVWFVATKDMVQTAIAITAAAFLVALVFLSWATWLTGRREPRSSVTHAGRSG